MKQTKESIQKLLETSDKAVIRGLLVIYGLQTASEQAAGYTKVYNGVGFSGVHAEFGSSLAAAYQRWGRLTPKQLAAARKMLRRYAGQLANVANGKIPNPLKQLPAPTPLVGRQLNATSHHPDCPAGWNRSKPCQCAVIQSHHYA